MSAPPRKRGAGQEPARSADRSLHRVLLAGGHRAGHRRHQDPDEDVADQAGQPGDVDRRHVEPLHFLGHLVAKGVQRPEVDRDQDLSAESE